MDTALRDNQDIKTFYMNEQDAQVSDGYKRIAIRVSPLPHELILIDSEYTRGSDRRFMRMTFNLEEPSVDDQIIIPYKRASRRPFTLS
jgi:hypothetical protein